MRGAAANVDSGGLVQLTEPRRRVAPPTVPHMDRRRFLLAPAGVLAALLAAEAQQAAKVARIGYLVTNLAVNPQVALTALAY
jgi:hypothetical protein